MPPALMARAGLCGRHAATPYPYAFLDLLNPCFSPPLILLLET